MMKATIATVALAALAGSSFAKPIDASFVAMAQPQEQPAQANQKVDKDNQPANAKISEPDSIPVLEGGLDDATAITDGVTQGLAARKINKDDYYPGDYDDYYPVVKDDYYPVPYPHGHKPTPPVSPKPKPQVHKGKPGGATAITGGVTQGIFGREVSDDYYPVVKDDYYPVVKDDYYPVPYPHGHKPTRPVSPKPKPQVHKGRPGGATAITGGVTQGIFGREVSDDYYPVPYPHGHKPTRPVSPKPKPHVHKGRPGGATAITDGVSKGFVA